MTSWPPLVSSPAVFADSIALNMGVPKLLALCWDAFIRFTPLVRNKIIYVSCQRYLEALLGKKKQSPKTLSLLCWEAFDRLTPAEKREFLLPYLQAREPIHRFKSRGKRSRESCGQMHCAGVTADLDPPVQIR